MREREPQSLERSTSPELMRKLMESFGRYPWKYTQQAVDAKGEFVMTLKNKTGSEYFEYEDFGKGENGSTIGVRYWDHNDLRFVLWQEVLWSKKGRKVAIQFRVEVPPFEDKYWVPGLCEGIHYAEDGGMEPARNIKGLPKKIDVDRTAAAFIEQLIARDFRKPQLITSKK